MMYAIDPVVPRNVTENRSTLRKVPCAREMSRTNEASDEKVADCVRVRSAALID